MRLGLTLGITSRIAGHWIGGFGTQFDFCTRRYLAGGTVAADLDGYQTRATDRYARHSSGEWQLVGAGKNAVLSATGYASGEASTNAITNPLMSGAVPGQTGAGGALPDGWLQGAVAGIDVTVTPITRDGLPALRVRMAGTNTAGSAQYPHLYFVTGVAAAPGQDWALASRIDITDASDLSGLSGGELKTVIQERQSGTYLANHQSSGFSSPGVHEVLLTATLANANCNQIRAGMSLPIAAGGTIDFTLEIVAPRLVQAAYDQGFGVGATAADALVDPGIRSCHECDAVRDWCDGALAGTRVRKRCCTSSSFQPLGRWVQPAFCREKAGSGPGGGQFWVRRHFPGPDSGQPNRTGPHDWHNLACGRQLCDRVL